MLCISYSHFPLSLSLSPFSHFKAVKEEPICLIQCKYEISLFNLGSLMPETTLLKRVLRVLCVQCSFESQAELLSEVLTAWGAFARNVASPSHVWCCLLILVQSLRNSLFLMTSMDPNRRNIFPGWTRVFQGIKGCNLVKPAHPTQGWNSELMASISTLCGAFHFILQGWPPLSHLFEALFSGLFPGWLLLGVRSPRTTRKSPGAAVQLPCATCLD